MQLCFIELSRHSQKLYQGALTKPHLNLESEGVRFWQGEKVRHSGCFAIRIVDLIDNKFLQIWERCRSMGMYMFLHVGYGKLRLQLCCNWDACHLLHWTGGPLSVIIESKEFSFCPLSHVSLHHCLYKGDKCWNLISRDWKVRENNNTNYFVGGQLLIAMLCPHSSHILPTEEFVFAVLTFLWPQKFFFAWFLNGTYCTL